MAFDLNDTWGWIQKIIARLSRLESGAMLENSSITNGRMRFIGGLLRLDSGALLELIGQWRFFGNGAITGDVYSEGKWTQVGDYDFTGDGDLAGDVTMSGNFDLTGKFTSLNVRIEGGKIYVGAGANLIVIDGATGKVSVGSMVLDPSNHNGMITMPNDGQVLGFESNLELYGPSGPSGRNGIVIKPDEVNIAKLPVATSTTGLRWVAADIAGNLCVVPPNIGGPVGGPLQWPFPPSTVSSEYGPRESPGPGGSTFHEGMDFAPGEGTPIPAAASGTVELAGVNGGFGNCVIINHGGGLKTLYGHMQNLPSVTVGQQVSAGQIIGAVGNTGVSFGAHLHFEVHVNGSTVNPRTKLPQN